MKKTKSAIITESEMLRKKLAEQVSLLQERVIEVMAENCKLRLENERLQSSRVLGQGEKQSSEELGNERDKESSDNRAGVS